MDEQMHRRMTHWLGWWRESHPLPAKSADVTSAESEQNAFKVASCNENSAQVIVSVGFVRDSLRSSIRRGSLSLRSQKLL